MIERLSFILIFFLFSCYNLAFAANQLNTNTFQSKALGLQFKFSSDWRISPDRSNEYLTAEELIPGGGLAFVAVSKIKPYEYKKLDFYLDTKYSSCEELSKKHKAKHLKTKNENNREWHFGELTKGDILGHGVEAVFFGCTLMKKGQGNFNKNVPLYIFGYLKSDLDSDLRKTFHTEAQSILRTLLQSSAH